MGYNFDYRNWFFGFSWIERKESSIIMLNLDIIDFSSWVINYLNYFICQFFKLSVFIINCIIDKSFNIHTSLIYTKFKLHNSIMKEYLLINKMFKKPFKVSTSNQLSNKDKKSLKEELKKFFDINTLDKLFEQNPNIQQVKLQSSKMVVYSTE